jgi:hypothetical protein
MRWLTVIGVTLALAAPAQARPTYLHTQVARVEIARAVAGLVDTGHVHTYRVGACVHATGRLVACYVEEYGTNFGPTTNGFLPHDYTNRVVFGVSHRDTGLCVFIPSTVGCFPKSL